jgi:hypothetical protein
MVIFKLMTGITILTSVLVSPLSGLAQSSGFADTHQDGISSERHTDESAEPSEMRASIVDKDGDQFIAMTEEGQEFRLPVEGAPENVNVGDELRLVPDSDSRTIQVFKAEPSETGAGRKSDPQL